MLGHRWGRKAESKAAHECPAQKLDSPDANLAACVCATLLAGQFGSGTVLSQLAEPSGVLKNGLLMLVRSQTGSGVHFLDKVSYALHAKLLSSNLTLRVGPRHRVVAFG